ncbi:MAG: AraC family transcriptional regulator [Verrucomicrobiota bacterium]
MKPIYEIIAKKADESFACKERCQPAFDIGWHVHPELQMTLLLSGHGYRIVGDNIAPLKPGELVLIGSSLPHLWHHDDFGKGPRKEIHFITLNFRENFLGDGFLQLPEMTPVRNLFANARRGLMIKGATRERVAPKVRAIAQGHGLRRIVDLLEILDLLSQSPDLEPMASAGFVPEHNLVDEQRLSQVCTYIIQHLDEEIHRDTLARMVHLAPVSFSRYFKTRTGRTLPDFINELRVGRACRMLAEEEQSVTNIALACGFTNLAHFHRQFRRRIKLKPLEYRSLVNRREG